MATLHQKRIYYQNQFHLFLILKWLLEKFFKIYFLSIFKIYLSLSILKRYISIGRCWLNVDLLKPSSLRQIFFLVLKRQKYAFSESINRSNQGKVHTDIHMHTVQRAESTRGVKVFSRCVCVYARRHAHGQSRPPFVMPWTVAFQVALSMGFSRQEYWSGLPFPPPGNLPDPGI